MSGVNLSLWALRHKSLVVYFMLALAIAGVGSYLRLGRSEDPAFTIKTMIIQARWPGATIDQTLKQVTERLERKAQETPGLDFIKSYTKPGETTVFVNLKGTTSPRATSDAWYQVRKKINDMRGDLPQGVIGPGFNDEFGDTYGIVYAFTSDGFSPRETRDYVEDVRSKLLLTSDVSKIDVIGAQDEKVYVEYSTAKLAGLGLEPSALVAALQSQNAVAPAGVVQTGEEQLLVRVTGAFHSERDLANVNFLAGGKLLRLGDIAEVKRGYADPPQPIFRVNGQSAIALAISMREGGDVLQLGQNIEAAMARIKSDLPIGIEPVLVADQPVIVKHAIGDFLEALWESIGIVLAVSFVSLGFRAGAVLACSIPLVLAIVFVVMEIWGIDLQRISLGALIIALGLLVDDAMITVESMVTRLERGDSKDQAASFAYTSTAFPMLTGTLVTIAGFVPIGFAKSSAGEYTFSLFAVVLIALLTSWIVAVIFAPLIGEVLLKRPKTVHEHAPGRAMKSFQALLLGAMRWRWVTVGLTLLIFAASIYGMKFVPQQFFPTSDRPELLVDLKLPENSSIYATDAAATKLETALKGDADVERWSFNIGQGAVRFYLPLNVQLPNAFFAEAVVVAKSLEARDRLKTKLEAFAATELPQSVTRISPLELGPPVGWPVQYRVTGPDPSTVREIAYKLSGIMAADPRAQKINFDWIEPSRTVKVHVNQDQARLLGVSSQDLAQALNAVFAGATITQIRDDIYLVDVIARARSDERGSLATLRNLQVSLPGGANAPLSQMATFEYGQELPLIWRRDRVPALTVQSDVSPGVLPATLVAALKPSVEALNASLSPGYRIEAGGIVEESGKSQASVFVVAPVMLFLMFTILMIQLQSFQRLFLVVSVAPLGLIGVVGALLLSGKPLGFVALLGVLALTGMIARNSVILIDQIEHEKGRGMHPWDATIEATSHRFRPILLTAAAAILGMIPIAPTVFWGPMAFSIMGGLAVATLLTLVFLPALYVAWFRVKEPSAKPATQPTT
jgi:multidrug efflux pump subunit AcrB